MVLKITLDEINKSLKFSAFIAFGVLFAISLVQMILTNALFWQIVGVISGFIFGILLLLVLIKALKPMFRAIKQRRKRRRNKKGFFETIKSIFEQNTYFKIMAIVWFIILLVGLEVMARYLNLLDSPRKYEALTNLGFMVVTISTALFILNISKLFKRKKKKINSKK